MGRPPKTERMTEHLDVRLYAAEKRALKRLAAKLKRSMGDVVRELVLKKIKESA